MAGWSVVNGDTSEGMNIAIEQNHLTSAPLLPSTLASDLQKLTKLLQVVENISKMADPVSLLASIIAISTAGMHAGKVLLSVSSAYRSYDDETTGLATELRLLSETLLEVHGVVDDNPKLISKRALSNANEILEECQSIFNEIHRMIRKLDDSGNPNWWRRARWIIDRDRVLPLRARLESFKSTLTMLLSTMHLAKVKQARKQAKSSQQLKSKEKLLRVRVETEIVLNTSTIERWRSIESFQQSASKRITFDPVHNSDWLLNIIPTFDRPLSIYPSNPLLLTGSPDYENSLEAQQRDDKKKVKKAVLVLLNGWTTLDLSQDGSPKDKPKQDLREPEILTSDEAASPFNPAHEIKSTNEEYKGLERSHQDAASTADRSIPKLSTPKSEHRPNLPGASDIDLDKVSTATRVHSRVPSSPTTSSSAASEGCVDKINEETSIPGGIPPPPESQAMPRPRLSRRSVDYEPKRNIYSDYTHPIPSQPGSNSFLTGATGALHPPDSHTPSSYYTVPPTVPYGFQSTPWPQQQQMAVYDSYRQQQYPQFNLSVPYPGFGSSSPINRQNDRPSSPSNLAALRKPKSQPEELGGTNIKVSSKSRDEDEKHRGQEEITREVREEDSQQIAVDAEARRKEQEVKLIFDTIQATEERIEIERVACLMEAAKEAAKFREKARKEDWIKSLSDPGTSTAQSERSLYFTSAIGSTYRLPFKKCNHWKGMQNFIIKIHAAEGIELESDQYSSYALVDANHQIILPDVWEDLVHPGMVCLLQIRKTFNDEDNDATMAEQIRTSGLDHIRHAKNHIGTDQISYVRSSGGIRSSSSTKSEVGKSSQNLEHTTSAIKNGKKPKPYHNRTPKSHIRPKEAFVESEYDSTLSNNDMNMGKSLEINDGTFAEHVVTTSMNRSRHRSPDGANHHLWRTSNSDNQDIIDRIKQDLLHLIQKYDITSTGSDPMSNHVAPFEKRLWQDSNHTWSQTPLEVRRTSLQENLDGTTFVTSPRSEITTANHHPKTVIEQQIEHLTRLMQQKQRDKLAQRAADKQAHDEARLKRLEDAILSMASENLRPPTTISSDNLGPPAAVAAANSTGAKVELPLFGARDVSENVVFQKTTTPPPNGSYPDMSKLATSVTTMEKATACEAPEETRKKSFRKSIFQRLSNS